MRLTHHPLNTLTERRHHDQNSHSITEPRMPGVHHRRHLLRLLQEVEWYSRVLPENQKHPLHHRSPKQNNKEMEVTP